MQRLAIIGGGISGLSHAWFARQKNPELEISLFEPLKLGGQIRTETHETAILEPGPDSYFDRSGLFLKLVHDLGLDNELIRESKRSAKRYVYKEGYLNAAPKSAGGLIFTSLLFFPEKIKIFLAMRKKFSLWPTITLFDAARNVMGFSAAEYLASPFARGVFGSEAEDLEFSAIFPDLYRHIVAAPNVKAAMKSYAAERSSFWQEQLGNAKHEKGIFTFKTGLIALVEALEKNLAQKNVATVQDKIARISIDSSGKYQLASKTKQHGLFDQVVFCAPTEDVAYVMREFDKELSKQLGELKSSPINVVYNAWNKKEFSPSGYGFLVPRKERVPILGTIFSSNVFDGRIDENKFLTKTMLSGESELFKDAELASLAEESLARILKTKARPLWSKVYRHTPGIPKYAPGYSEWKKGVHTQLVKHPRLHLAGWSFDGVGLADQIESAYKRALTLNTKYVCGCY